MPGLVFDKYAVIERLAAGGMGEVLLARQVGGVEGFERLVILKTLLPSLAQDQSFVDQFVDEARVVATLSHPNVVSVFEVGVWDGSYYLAMEYIPGPNLSQLRTAARKAERVVPLALCAQIGLEAALGLDHAHTAKDLRGGRLGVVHRDVSPQNIMVRKDGLTKVVDFGIARAANRAHRTEAGMVKGKLGYMAPEQLRGRDLDGRADQFSLGATLWELCTGRLLFANESDGEMIRAVLNAPIPRPSDVLPDFPPALEDVLMRMLERDPEKRFPRLYEVAGHLTAWLKESTEPHDHEAIAAFIQEVGAHSDRVIAPEPPPNFVVAFKGSGPKATRAARRSGPGPAEVSATAFLPTTPSPARRQAAEVPTRPRPQRNLGFVALGVAALGAVAAGTWLASPLLWPPPAEVVTVIDAGVAPVAQVPVAPTPPPEESPPPQPRPSEENVAVVVPPPTNATKPDKPDKGGKHGVEPKHPDPPRPPVGEGRLAVRTTPWTMVFVDGRKLNTTPLDESVSAGPHTLQLVNRDQGIDVTRQITVAVGETLKLNLDLNK